jgi:outer membrane autotransporter protein
MLMNNQPFSLRALAHSDHAARPDESPSMKPKTNIRRLTLACAAALAALFAAPATSQADQLFWDGRTSNVWTDPNWATTASDAGTLSTPTAATDVVFSITTGAINQNTQLGMDFTIHSLTINDPVPVTIGGANMLTVSGASGTTGITVNSGAGLLTINITGTLTLAGTSNTITVNNAAGAVIDSVVGGSIGMVKAGAGNLTLLLSTTYTGPTIVNGGTLLISGPNNSVNISSTSSVTINSGGTILIVGDNNYLGFTPVKTVTQTTTINQGGALVLGGAYTAQLGPVTLLGGTLATSGPLSGDALMFGSFNLGHGVTAGGVAATSTISAQGVVLSEPGGTVFNVSPGAANGVDLNVTGSFTDAGGAGTHSALVKQGAGVMVLSGMNTYIEATTILAGTLQFAKEVSFYNNSPASAGKVTVASGATIAFNVGGPGEFTAPDLSTILANDTGFASGAKLGLDTTNAAGGTFTYANPITDANNGASSLGLVKLGTGTLTLTAANTYTGGTTLMAGTIGIGNANALSTGPVTVAPGGGSIFAAGADRTVGNAFTLSGGLTVVDDPSGAHNLTLAGQLSGPGGLTMNGTGSLTLSALNTFTGNTVVNQGSLFVDGSTASANTIVMPGGLLGGHGALGGNLNNGGVVSPGNSPGTLTVKGNFSQSPTGTLLIQVAGLAPSQHDLLAVGGLASLGGTLQLQQLNGFEFHLGDKFAFLTAGGGIAGKFATVVDPFFTDTLVGVEVVYLSNSILLEGAQIPFTAIPGETPNQRAVADALDASLSNPRNASLIAHLDSESLSKVLNDLDRIAPDELTSIYQIAISQAKVQTANLQRRLEDIRAGSNGFSAAGLAMNGGAPPQTGSYELAGPTGLDGKDGKESKTVFTPTPDNRWGVFVTGTGEWASVGDTSNSRGYDLTNAGFTLGIDYKLTDHFVIGLATGYDHSSADLTGNGRVTVDGGKLALYSSYFTGKGFYTDLAVQGGYNGYDTHRAALEGSAIGSEDGGELNVLFGTGYDWKIGGLTFGPTGNFDYTYVGLDSFGERGSLAPLDFPGQHQESIRSTFGAKVSYDWKIGSVLIKPELRAGWQHEYGDATLGIDSSFANGASPDFLVHGPATGRDSLVLSAGIAVQLSERVSTYVYYDGELARTNYEANSVSGGFRFDF